MRRLRITGPPFHLGAFSPASRSLPDGKTLATGHNDGSVSLWNTDFSPHWRQFYRPFNGGFLGLSPQWDVYARKQRSHEGKYVIAVCDVETEEERLVLTPNAEPQSVAFSPDGRTLAVTDYQKSTLFHLGSGRTTQLVGSFRGIRDGSYIRHWRECRFSPDGKVVANFGNETLRVCDSSTGRPRFTVDGVEEFTFSPDGILLATAGEEFILWNVSTGSRILCKGYSGSLAGDPLFSPDGSRIAGLMTFASSEEFAVWDTESGQRLVHEEFRPAIPVIYDIPYSFSPDSNLLATAGTRLVLHDVAAGKVPEILSEGAFFGPKISPDQKSLAVFQLSPWPETSPTDIGVALRIWDLESRELRSSVAISAGYTYKDCVWQVTYSPNGTSLVLAGAETIKLLDPLTGEERCELDQRIFGSLRSPHVRFSRDGRFSRHRDRRPE